VTVDVEVAGRVRRIEGAPSGIGWRLSIDGVPFDVDAARAGDRWSILVGPADGGHPHASYEVSVDDHGRGELVLHVDGRAVAVTIVDPRSARIRGAHDQGIGVTGPTTIVAPMSGRVVKLLVKPGDEVMMRQGLVLVEAMKMQNELRAPRDGRVVEVRVAEGASVEANAVLVVIG